MDAIVKRILSDQDRRHGEILQNLETLRESVVELGKSVLELVAVIKPVVAKQETEPFDRRPPGRRSKGENP